MRTLCTSRFTRAAVAIAGGAALVGGMIVAAAAPASASVLTCGTTVTASVTLTANVDCTSDTTDDAITIGAADVTVDLNGYSILGPGNTAGTEGIVDNGHGSGVPYNDVTIENGTISNFVSEVDIEGVSGSDLTGAVVKSLTITNSTIEAGDAVIGFYLSGASIHNLSINDAQAGIELVTSQASTVSNNHLQSPVYGLADFGGVGDTWSHNSLSDVNGEGIFSGYGTADIVELNTVTGTSATGVYDEDSSGLTVTKNVLNGLYGGIADLGSTDGSVSSNTGTNDSYGIYADDTDDYTYTANKFQAGQIGIETDFPEGEVLKGNVTSHNSEAGVYVYTEDESCPADIVCATLNDNTGNDNRFGLYSQIPTSGSKNHASGNKVVQCYNVTCAAPSPRSGAGPVPAPAHVVPRFSGLTLPPSGPRRARD